jgi:hypothetical protein
MATYSVTHQQRIDNVAVVQTLEPTDIAVGQSVVLTGMGNGLNGTHTVTAVPTYLFTGVSTEGDLMYDYDVVITNQILFLDTGDDVTRQAVDPYGTLTYTITCTWITSNNVTEFLGIAVASANDTAFLATCVAAANAFAYRKRQEAGYFDSKTTSPGGDVTLGTTLYAAGLYRERGSIDSFQSFQDMSVSAPTMTMGRVMQLLGCNRSQVA